MILIAVLWAVYVSECFVRWRPSDWVFRRSPRRLFCGTHRPDITFWNERLAFAWTSAWPADIALRARGGSLDADTCRARIYAATQQTRPLRLASTVLFLVLLVLFPALILFDRLLVVFIPFAGVVAGAWATTLTLFFRTYSRVHGRRPPLETCLTHALSPVSLIVSPTAVMVDLVADTHPVAVAHAVCDDTEFLRIARIWHVDAPAAQPEINRLAASRGLLDHLMTPPTVVDAGISHYCPRCHATYVGRADTCVDCHGVALIPLQTAKPLLKSSSRNDDPNTLSRASGMHDVRARAHGPVDGRARRRARHPR